MSTAPSPADAIERLIAALARPGPGDLEARILAEQTAQAGDPGPGGALLERLLRGLHLALVRDRLPLRMALARAQFAAAQARQPLHPDGRLSGEAQALNLRLARALSALPDRHARPLFDAAFYAGQNPDVVAAGLDPLRHYLDGGAAEGRRPAPPVDEATADIAGLLASDVPRFLPDHPAALRDEMLALAGAVRPRISVILPCWNRGHVLRGAIASALLQSLAPAEILVIDDGSTDGSAERVAAWFPEALEDGRIVLLARPHEGVSAARNAGLAAARGDIVAYLDSDNSWEPDHLLTLAAGLCRPGAPPCAYTALARHDLDGGWSDVLFAPFDRARLEEANTIDLNAFGHRRALYDSDGGFDPGLTRLVDWDLILRYTARAAPVALPVITGHYVQAGAALGNISATEDLEPNTARIRAKLARQDA